MIHESSQVFCAYLAITAQCSNDPLGGHSQVHPHLVGHGSLLEVHWEVEGGNEPEKSMTQVS